MSPMRVLFAIYVSCIAMWVLAIYLNLFLGSLLVEEVVFAAAAAMLTAQFWFAKIFPTGEAPARLRSYWSLAIGSFFVVASFYPNALFTSITVHPEGFTTLDNGPLSAAYSLFALVFVFAPAIVFFRKYRAETREPLRQQLKYLTIGFTISLVVELLANSVLPVFFQVYSFNAIGPAFSLIFASVAFYIISKHNFLDVRKTVLRGATYSLVIGMLVIADILLLVAIEQYLESIRLFTWIHADDVIDPLTAILITAIGIATAPLIERYFQRITDRVFYKDRYNYAAALESLSAVLAENADFDQLVRHIRESLAKILRAESVDVILYDEREDARARETHAPLLETREVLLQPVLVNHEEIGYILVGPKRSGDKYDRRDQLLLRTFALQASTALARVQLFMQVRRHADELEQKVAQRTAQLEQAHESERHMLLDVAHGLQSPLTVFRTKLEAMRSPKQGPMQIEALEQSLIQLSEFVSDLLRLAQLEQFDELHLEDCEASDLIRDLCDEIETIAAQSGITLERSIEPEITLRADARELRSAIMNIASNSIKYMGDTGPEQVSIRFITKGADAILTISDTGPGIAPEDLRHIFDRFYRVKNSSVAGNGLGLPLSKRIVERHGGTIEVTSEVGIGTSTVIRLPLPQPRSLPT